MPTASELSTLANQESIRLSTLLLGLSASAIAFAVHETSDRQPTLSLAIIGVATASWAASFFFGIQYAHTTQGAIKTNAAMNGMTAAHPRWAEADAKNRTFQRATGRNYQKQLWALWAGAIIYVAGHALHTFENGQKELPARSIVAPGADTQPSPPTPLGTQKIVPPSPGDAPAQQSREVLQPRPPT